MATRLAAFSILTISSDRARGSPGGQLEIKLERPVELAQRLGVGTGRL